MANFFGTNKVGSTSLPRVKSPMEEVGGRLRATIARFGTIDAAQNDILFIGTFKLGDVIHSVEVASSVDLAGGVTGDLGPYRVLAATGDTPVLSPIQGGTAAEDRFATAVVIAGAVRPLSGTIQLWGESGVPASWMPLWEALGFADYATALLSIPDGVIDLGLKLETANPAASNISVKVVYNAGD